MSSPDRGAEPGRKRPPARIPAALRLEVKYPDKPAHEVELKGTLAVIGRDPSCDLVVNDERCSRRHAVLEITPTGLQVRDAGSANGVFVNGKKRERSSLVAGDLVRLGEVILKVLPDGPAGTVVMAPDDLVELGPPPSPSVPAGPVALGTEARSVPAAKREASRAPAPVGSPAGGQRSAPRGKAGPSGRPLTITVLAALWLLSIFIYGAAALGAPSFGLQGTMSTTYVAVCALLVLLSALMAFGLLALKPWARLLQTALAGVGLVVCPFTLASATTLIYMLRPTTRAAFSSSSRGSVEDPSEMTFALTLLGTAALGGVLIAAGLLATRFVR